MDDLISRSALLDAYDKAHQGPPGGARKLIENAPDAIVRCKDCKNWEECYKWVRPEGGSYIAPRCSRIMKKTKYDWFCADGERK